MKRSLWVICALLSIVTLPVGLYKTYQGWQVSKYGVIVEGTVVSFPDHDAVGISLLGKIYEMPAEYSRTEFHLGEKLRMRYVPGKEPLFEKEDPLLWGGVWLSFNLLLGIGSVVKFRKKDPGRNGSNMFIINSI